MIGSLGNEMQLHRSMAVHNTCMYQKSMALLRGDNPRALANGLSPVHADEPGILTILYRPHQCDIRHG